jgi:hypothetical protein
LLFVARFAGEPRLMQGACIAARQSAHVVDTEINATFQPRLSHLYMDSSRAQPRDARMRCPWPPTTYSSMPLAAPGSPRLGLPRNGHLSGTYLCTSKDKRIVVCRQRDILPFARQGRN